MNQNVCCIGAGYIGGTTMVVAASKNPWRRFDVVDCDCARIAAWNSNSIPIYEPNLAELVECVRGVNLFFSTDIEKAVDSCDTIFIGVCTPTKYYGEGSGEKTDLSYWEKAARDIKRFAHGKEKIIVEKSTLPVGTAKMLDRILNDGGRKQFHIVSNPEFLAEGTAVQDLLTPSRVLIGGELVWADEVANLYRSWVKEDKIVLSNVYSAELTKLVSNFMLAQRVTDANAVAQMCEKTGADVGEVMKCVGMDERIGSHFLKAGAGFGGSCFKKDILNLTYIARSLGLDEVAKYFESVVTMNELHKSHIVERLMDFTNGSLARKKVAVLGYSFKANTGDTRETPSERIIQDLLNEWAFVWVYDPKATCLYEGVNVARTMDVAVCSADAVIVMVDWDEFKGIDLTALADRVGYGCIVYDVRNCLKAQSVPQSITLVRTGSR